MKVFVINAYKDRREKYDERYTIFPAIWWEDVTEEQLERYHYRHNAKIPLRKKITACSLSHKRLIQKIIDEDLKEVVIIEDDAVINDFNRLEELKDLNEFCYIGGDVSSPLLKDMKKFINSGEKQEVRESFKKGLIDIDPKIFRIGWNCSYYIPNKEVAEMILSNIPNGKKELSIDGECMKLQKKGNIRKFIYPAIATLNINDAKKGFTFSNYKLYSDNSYY